MGIKKNIIEDTDLGGVLNPISNNQELKLALKSDVEGPYNTVIFTKGTFQVDNNNLAKMQERNIVLLGEAFATLSKNIEKHILEGTGQDPIGLMSISKEEKGKYINGKY